MEYVVPKKDAMCGLMPGLFKNSKNKENAEAFINFM